MAPIKHKGTVMKDTKGTAIKLKAMPNQDIFPTNNKSGAAIPTNRTNCDKNNWDLFLINVNRGTKYNKRIPTAEKDNQKLAPITASG